MQFCPQRRGRHGASGSCCRSSRSRRGGRPRPRLAACWWRDCQSQRPAGVAHRRHPRSWAASPPPNVRPLSGHSCARRGRGRLCPPRSRGPASLSRRRVRPPPPPRSRCPRCCCRALPTAVVVVTRCPWCSVHSTAHHPPRVSAVTGRARRRSPAPPPAPRRHLLPPTPTPTPNPRPPIPAPQSPPPSPTPNLDPYPQPRPQPPPPTSTPTLTPPPQPPPTPAPIPIPIPTTACALRGPGGALAVLAAFLPHTTRCCAAARRRQASRGSAGGVVAGGGDRSGSRRDAAPVYFLLARRTTASNRGGASTRGRSLFGSGGGLPARYCRPCTTGCLLGRIIPLLVDGALRLPASPPPLRFSAPPGFLLPPLPALHPHLCSPSPRISFSPVPLPVPPSLAPCGYPLPPRRGHGSLRLSCPAHCGC